MDTVESVATAKRTLFKMTKPSKTMWLVAHNGSDIAHVIELPKDCECLTGMPNLEECGSQQAAEDRAKVFGWKACGIGSEGFGAGTTEEMSHAILR